MSEHQCPTRCLRATCRTLKISRAFVFDLASLGMTHTKVSTKNKSPKPRNRSDLNSGKDGANPKNTGNEAREVCSGRNHRLGPLANVTLYDHGGNQREEDSRHLHAKARVGIMVTAV